MEFNWTTKMMNSDEQTLDPDRKMQNHNPSNQRVQAFKDWESTIRDWLSTLPENKTVTVNEFEQWFKTNESCFPDEVKSMPQANLYELFNSIQNTIITTKRPSLEVVEGVEEKDPSEVDPLYFRFQRTDQWMPVYAWLEALDTDEVIKSKDILDWLSENPEIRDQLYSRHSRYHLMHYVKKCHVKILKRKEKKNVQPEERAKPVRVHKAGGAKLPALLPCTTFKNPLPKDSDIYRVKREEAFHKYEILLELEKQILTIVSKQQNVN